MNKYLYKIKDLDIPTWVKYWFLKRSKINFDLSEILNGTSFDLTDTVNKKLHLINIYGNSEQETTTGKNKIGLANLEETSLNGLTFSILDDVITINGSANDTTKISNVLFDIPIGSNSLNIIPISGEWKRGAIGIRGKNAYDTQKWYSQITYSNIEQKTTYDFTNEEINNTSIVELYCTASVVFNNYKFKIMMVAGNVVDKDFEKFTFGASPNPDYSQEINSSGDNGYITEKIVNKNLFNKNNVIDGYRLGSEGTNFPSSGYSVTDFIKVKPSTNFYRNRAITIMETVCLYDKDKNFISRLLNGNAFTTTENTYYIKTDVENIYLDSTQLELGSTATDYEPHQEQTYNIPCQQPMRAIGAVKDTFVKVNDVWYERHYISRILSYNGEEITTEYMSTTGELSTGATVDYVSETPLDLLCTQEQIIALENLQKAKTYKNVTHIFSEDNISPNLEIQYYKEKGE